MDDRICRMALFSDGTTEYVDPQEPGINEPVRIRIRAKSCGIKRIFILHDMEKVEMNKQETFEGYDYYEVIIVLGEDPFQYLFLIEGESEIYYYDRLGVTDHARRDKYFKIVPGFSTPDWAKGAVMYQIFPDRFYNGDWDNDTEEGEYIYLNKRNTFADVWNKYPKPGLLGEFYGGDLAGIIQKLDYLQNLGVEAIYMNPIFVSPSNHKYDVQDYDYVDPHLGKQVVKKGELLEKKEKNNQKATRYISSTTDILNLEASNEVLIELIKQAHQREIRVILDGVFNHCGSFHKWMDTDLFYARGQGYHPGAYASKESPYRSFFKFKEDNSYEGWWGYATLPKLNFEGSPELEKEILRIAAKWVSPPFCADGWRLDVAADLGHGAAYNHSFWRKFRKTVKEANPEALILAEHYGSAQNWLNGYEWDTIMNYNAFMEPVSYFLTGMEKHSDEFKASLMGNSEYFEDTMKRGMNDFLTSSLQCSMNQLSNHDHSRFLTRTNHKVGRVEKLGHKAAESGVMEEVLRMAVVIQMTWPGAPTLYYGDEAGLCGFTDPDNRRTYPWGSENKDLIAFHKAMISIHKNSEALRKGSFTFLMCEQNVVGYARFTREEQIVVLVNCDEFPRKMDVSMIPAGIEENASLEQIFYTNDDLYSVQKVTYEMRADLLDILLPSRSVVVLQKK